MLHALDKSVSRAQLPRLTRQPGGCCCFSSGAAPTRPSGGLFMADSCPAIELGGLLAPDSQADVWGGSGRCVTKVSMSMRRSRSGARIFAGERKNLCAGSSFRWAPWGCTMSLALTCLVPARLPLARSCTPQGRWARCKSPPSSRSSSASASAERSLSSRGLP